MTATIAAGDRTMGPAEYEEWAAEVRRLADERGAVVLAHDYQVPEIQDVAHFTGDSLYLSQIAAHPDAEVLVHPECGCTTSVPDLVSHGDLPADRTRVLSTGGMAEAAAATTAGQVLVATEIGILHQLRSLNRSTEFIPMNARAACRYMKMITPAKLLHTLRTGEGAVDVDEVTAARARKAVEAMIAIGEPGRGGE